MRNIKQVFLVLGLVFSVLLYSQGCSDAGFCTVGGLKHERDSLQNKLIFGFTYGKGDKDLNVYSPFVEYERKFSDKFSLNSKLTYQAVSGDLGNASGLGDIYLSGIYSISLKEAQKLSFTGGIKIPLSNPDKDGNENILLPLDYQPSLGTFDLILGSSYQFNNWNFSLGYQQPLTQNDKGFYGDYTRKSDGLLKVSYNLKINNKFTIQPSTLLINHFGEDEYEFGNQTLKIDGSSGITWNGAVDFNYQINPKNKLGLLLATPFVVRDARPDGLTREFVAAIKYSIGF